MPSHRYCSGFIILLSPLVASGSILLAIIDIAEIMVPPCFNTCCGGIGSGTGNEIVKYSWKKLKTHACYFIYCKKKFEKLKEQFDLLKAIRDDTQQKVEAAKRNNKVISDEVNLWLNKVLELEGKFNNIEKNFNRIVEDEKFCIPSLVSRYKVGREATRKKDKALKLLDRSNFQAFSHPLDPSTVNHPSNADFVSFGATKEAMQKVIDALNDDKVNLIGIYGMGGVGKTTLMEEIGRMVKGAKTFDVVIDVVVSQNPNIAQIQRDIADALDMRESSNKMLATRLKQEKKVLIMLDDVWARLELVKAVGIPYREHKGCKVILTSRKAETCNVMETDVSVEVATLSEEDSWHLFRMRAGQVAASDGIEPIARKVAQECCGLPLAIVVVGRALRSYKDSSAWEDALSQLKQAVPLNMEEVEEKLYKPLELSYQNLKTAELKQLFLYCCLFREDYDISEDEVTRYAVGENLLSNLSTLEDVRGRVHFLLQKLKLSCLLLDSKKAGCVKLHDVVRDVAVYIGSKDNNHFLVKAGHGLTDWPECGNLSDCKRISLSNNFLQEIPEKPNCSKLILLLLNMNPITWVPINFFENMATLTVLDFSNTGITSLPSSLTCLNGLGTLRLDRCKQLKDINVVGELKTLIILTLQECRGISALPETIDGLLKLKLLDLSNCTSLQILRNFIPKLTQLEELYLRGYNVTEELLVEVASLKRLVRVELYVKCARDFSEQVFPNNAYKVLRHFIIYNEPDWFSLASKYQRNFFIKQASQSMISWGKPFLRSAEELRLDSCQWNFTDLMSCFATLKSLLIVNCHQIQCLLWSTDDTPSNAFGELMKLTLSDMEKLEQVCHGQLPAHSLGKLRTLELRWCRNIVDILPQDLLQRVHPSLVELLLEGCPGPHVLLNFEGLGHDSIIFPKLQMIRVSQMSDVISFCNGVVPPGSLHNLTTFEVVNCKKLLNLFSQTLDTTHSRLLPSETFKKLKQLQIMGCPCLKHVFLPSIANELQSLERLEIKNNSSIETIIANEEGCNLKKGAFPILKRLLFIKLPRLICFFEGEPAKTLDWPSLEYIHFGDCSNLARLPIGHESAQKLKKVHVARLDDVNWFESLKWEVDTIKSRFDIIQSINEVK
ncbi:probable disease resistance protein At4g27220 [Zingiber officinale]|uniref:probable disease resistance protein At4g27220 n=1 Tax=Zingiber officinale TaxID=94328 RepID=UPI001C4AEE2D|nr:probable disease resistance protein At4g27220 [Zingiber officinale]